MSDQFNIRALGREDLEDFRAMRLKALRAHPNFFGETAEKAETYDLSFRQETLDGQGKCIFGLYEGNQIIGITGVFTDRDDPSGQTAVLAMSYIEPQHRGKNLSRLLYQARIDWAKAQPQFTRIAVSHREGNESSRRANQAFGFEYIGSKEKTWPDSSVENDCQYVMRIER